MISRQIPVEDCAYRKLPATPSQVESPTFVVYGLVRWLVVIGIGKLLRKLESSAAAHLKGIRIQRSEILGTARITRILATTLQLFRIVAVFTLAYLRMAAEFSYFPYTLEHSATLLAYVTSPVRNECLYRSAD